MEVNRNQTNLNRIQMANEHHSNPYVSIFSGAIGGLYAFIQTNGFLIENAVEFFKIVVFGIIGGACGYVGKHLMEQFINKIKEKSKNSCK